MIIRKALLLEWYDRCARSDLVHDQSKTAGKVGKFIHLANAFVQTDWSTLELHGLILVVYRLMFSLFLTCVTLQPHYLYWCTNPYGLHEAPTPLSALHRTSRGRNVFASGSMRQEFKFTSQREWKTVKAQTRRKVSSLQIEKSNIGHAAVSYRTTCVYTCMSTCRFMLLPAADRKK